jgi:hypothetical protein
MPRSPAPLMPKVAQRRGSAAREGESILINARLMNAGAFQIAVLAGLLPANLFSISTCV